MLSATPQRTSVASKLNFVSLIVLLYACYSPEAPLKKSSVLLTQIVIPGHDKGSKVYFSMYWLLQISFSLYLTHSALFIILLSKTKLTWFLVFFPVLPLCSLPLLCLCMCLCVTSMGRFPTWATTALILQSYHLPWPFYHSPSHCPATLLSTSSSFGHRSDCVTLIL